MLLSATLTNKLFSGNNQFCSLSLKSIVIKIKSKIFNPICRKCDSGIIALI